MRLSALTSPRAPVCSLDSVLLHSHSHTVPLRSRRQIPFYPIVKKDLTFIHLGNDTWVDGLVNFEKLRMIAKEVCLMFVWLVGDFFISQLSVQR